MGKIVTIDTESTIKPKKRVPDVNDIQREKRLCDLALDAVERRIRDGKATSAELLHFLKLASEKNKYEQEELHYRTEMLKAKTQAIAAAEKSNEDYAKVLQALSRYSGTVSSSEEEEVSDIFY